MAWTAVSGDDTVFVERVNIAHVGVTNGDAYAAPFVIVGDPDDETTPAERARLIAAAPEMLDALKDALKLAKLAGKLLTGCRADDDYVWGLEAKFAAAIEKAGG